VHEAEAPWTDIEEVARRARQQRHHIQREIDTPASGMMLRGDVKEGDTLRVGFAAGDFTFDAERREAAPPAEEVEAPPAPS
jgi:hypothetical protein